ncbi:hypothetical protein AMATHDRAFT_143916 [Amanita thiersii Skay4041]|uniref:Uncharacterized protein n=1 Tax=Amanita thiersii Skay4041 TaxID=703135 RepID=A0A2A9NRJ1_9AGAR|nr:hypothetical protein AMATHDRAFT_143916 [Amanita thiersii Skay4041]
MPSQRAAHTPADFVTYRYGQKLVYVAPVYDYEQAVNIAQKEYTELAQIPRDRILFSISAPLHGKKHMVRISESAWSAAMQRVLRGEIIDIHIRADPLLQETVSIYDESQTPKNYWGIKSRPKSSDCLSTSSRNSKDQASSRRSWFKRSQ